ncbi:MAG: Feruloyl-CoA synthase, partial [Rhizobacter sp.]|nr:Feruloyl-CoA synthase [Rhizobacter sp.]
MTDDSSPSQRSLDTPQTLRFTGLPAPADLITPVRRLDIECVTRPDGSTVIGWSAQTCRLEAGTASAEAPTTCVVGNVTDWLDVWAQERPDTLLLAERGPDGAWASTSYGEAARRVRSIAAQLLRLCAVTADHQPQPLAILSGNSVRQALLTFAALYVGIPVAPISPTYTTSGGDHARLRLVLDKLRPSLVYSETTELASAALTSVGMAAQRLLTAVDVDAWSAGTEPVDTAALDAAHASARGSRVAKIMFTSGSTGSPKGVVMTHSMLTSAQATTAAVLRHMPTVPQVYLEWLPWHHVMGGNINLHRALRFGASIYLDGGRPVPAKIGETIANIREVSPTFYFNVPLGYALLVPALERDSELAKRFFAKLEYMTFGGASLSVDLVRRLGKLAADTVQRIVPVVSGFGATETSGPALGTTWSMDSGGAVGLPAPGIAIKLVPLQDRFELRLAGGNLMSTYLGEPELSAAAFDEEGFYRIGDAVQWIDPA